MVAKAIDKAGTDDPVKVGYALEGMTFQGPLGEVQMRASDHQMQMPLIISSLSKDYKYPIVYKGRDFKIAFKTDGVATRKETTLPTTCKMKRPKA